MRCEIDKLLALGIIKPSSSPWASSIVMVGKKDGGVRMCIDFRAINGITQPDPYQMPLIEEILEMLASARFLSKIDLNKGSPFSPVIKRRQHSVPLGENLSSNLCPLGNVMVQLCSKG